MQKFQFEVTTQDIENKELQRLDKFLLHKFQQQNQQITRSKIQHLIKEGLAENEKGKIKDSSHKINLNEQITVFIPQPKSHELTPKQIDFEIVFEDEDLMVINKPAGLTVHPGAGNEDNTLVNALLFSHQNDLSKINGDFRPGIVHRLDKDTTGLMLIAKNDFVHQELARQIKDREVKRSYIAFVYGKIEPSFGKINKNITRSHANRLKMAVVHKGGKTAITNYSAKETYLNGFASMVECRLETGRTHQIRVHMAAINHGVIGDEIYCRKREISPKLISDKARDFINNFPRQALHSYKISFMHPTKNEEKSFEIDLPKDLKQLQKHLKNG